MPWHAYRTLLLSTLLEEQDATEAAMQAELRLLRAELELKRKETELAKLQAPSSFPPTSRTSKSLDSIRVSDYGFVSFETATESNCIYAL